MPSYRAPLRDMHFVLDELLDAPAHYASLQGCEEVTPDLLARIKTAAASGVLPADFINQVNMAVTAAKRVGLPLMGLVFGLSFIIFPFFPVIAFREKMAPPSATNHFSSQWA